MSRAPVAFRSALIVSTVGLALVTPGAARAALPSFTYSPASPYTGDLVTLTSSFSGVTETWDLDGDTACDDASGHSIQWSFQAAGTYTVRLCVTDGATSLTAEQKITVLNRPPVAAFTYAPLAPLTGDQVVLTSASVDPDGPIASLSWDLDNDGAFDDASGVTASLSFPTAGAHTVRLLAADRDGATSVAVQTITVGQRLAALLGPFPVVRVIARVTGRGARIREVIVKAPAGSKVMVRCRGRGCRSRQLTRTVPRKRSVRIRRFRSRTLRPGAALRIWVTKPDRVGKYTRFRIRRGKRPKRVDLCVMPGATRPARCPSS